MLNELPNVTIIGESTQGILSDKLEKQLPCGIKFSLSNERYLTMANTWHERTGIPVEKHFPYATNEQLALEHALIEPAHKPTFSE